MVATKILGLYSTIWGPMLSNEASGHDIIDFAEKLPKLRSAFTCCVCDQLMTNREVISPTACLEHFACKACRGKDRSIGRKCQKCEDWNTFEENAILETLLKSYQTFCRYILTCERLVRLLEVKHEVDPGFDTHELIDLLAEGVRGAPKVGAKRKLPIDVLKEGRGIIPIPVPAKRGKKVPLKEDNIKGTVTPSIPSATPVSTVVTKGTEPPSDSRLNVANQSDLADKSKLQVGNKQPEKVTAKAPPLTTTIPVPSTPIVSSVKQPLVTVQSAITVSSPGVKSAAVSSNVSSAVAKSVTVSSPAVPKIISGPGPVIPKSVSVPSPVPKSVVVSSTVPKTAPFSSPVPKSVVVSSLVSKSVVVSSTVPKTAPVPSPVTKSVVVSSLVSKSVIVSSTVPKTAPVPSPVTKSVVVSSPVTKTVVVSSPVTKSVVVSSPVTKTVTVTSHSNPSVPVVKHEAIDGTCILPDRPSNVSFEAERSPRKNSEEDTYILGLSPSTSPIKTVPSSAANVTTATIISSSPVTSTMNSHPMSMPSFKFAPNLTSTAQRQGTPQFVQFSQTDQWKTVQINGQQIRLTPNFASFSPGRIPVQVFRSQGVPMSSSGVIGTGGSPPLVISANMQQTATNPPTSVAASTQSATGGPAPPRRRVFLTQATAQDLHKWADPGKALQFHAADFGMPTFAALKPNVLSVAHAALQARSRLPSTSGTSGTSGTITNVRSIPTTGSLVRPITTNTVTPTIARGLLRQPVAGTSSTMSMPHATNVQFVRTSLPGNAGPVILRTEGMASTQSTAVPSQVPVSTTTPTTNNPLTTTSASKRKQEGCRCGNATPTPGKLTCIGQRCACYAEKTACLDCKCKGCKNPYVPGGQKIIPGVRTLIDPQTNQAIPLLAAPMNSVAGGHTTATFVNSGVATSNPTIMAAIGPASNFGPIQAGGSSMQNSVQIIPIRYGPPGYTPQYFQIAGPHGVPIILSSAGGHIQASSGGGITIQGLPGMSVSGLGGLSTASGPVHQVSASQIPRPGVVPVSGAMKVDRGLNE